MEAVFLSILDMSLTGSYVILAILAARLLLRSFPKKYSYALWAVAGFRLCCPVSFSSVFSLFRLPYVHTGDAITEPLVSALPQQLTVPQQIAIVPSVGQAVAAPTPAVGSSILHVLGILWLAGLAVMLLYGALSYFRLRASLVYAVKLQGNVYQSDMLHTPFILGIFHPRIYLPIGLNQEAADYVLAHEQCHLRRKDHFVKLLAFGVLAVHWFNPLCYVAFRLMCKDMEMSCDETVLAAGSVDRHNYSATLVSIAANRKFPMPSPLAFGESGVKSRVKNALRWKQPRRWVTIVAAILCLCIGAACAANPPHGGVPEPGKYILLSALEDKSGSYLTVEGQTIQTGPYAAREEYSMAGKTWEAPPFTQEEWEKLTDPYSTGMKKPLPAKIQECAYMDMGTVVGNLEVETAAGFVVYENVRTHTFLLREDGQFYYCKAEYREDSAGVAVKYMIPAWSEQDPVRNGITEIDSWVNTLLSGGGLQTTEISEQKLHARIAENEQLYKGIYSHPHILYYLCHMFLEEGVSGEKEMFVGILFEKVMDRMNEAPIIQPTTVNATQTFREYIAQAQRLYQEMGYSKFLAEYPATSSMLFYLTNEDGY